MNTLNSSTPNVSLTEEHEGFSGIPAQQRDKLLEHLCIQESLSAQDRIIKDSDILYSHAWQKDSNWETIIEPGARLYQKIIWNDTYHDDTEWELIGNMRQEVREKLQQVDCWIYKWVGDWTKLLTFFLKLFNISSQDTDVLKEKLTWKVLILQDVSAEFLAKTQKLFKEYWLHITAQYGDFFDQDNNGKFQILGEKNCILMLWKTAGNFDKDDMKSLFRMNVPNNTVQKVYFYATYESSDEFTENKYIDNTAIDTWILWWRGALLWREHIDKLDKFKVITHSHAESEDSKVPARILVWVTPLEDVQILRSDKQKTFTFKKWKQYFLIASARPNTSNLNHFLEPNVVYEDSEWWIGSESKDLYWYPVYRPVLQKKVKVFDTYQHRISLFCELKYTPPDEKHISHDILVAKLLKWSSKIRSLQHKVGIQISNFLDAFSMRLTPKNLIIFFILACTYLYSIHVENEKISRQEIQKLLEKKMHILCDAKDRMIPNDNITQDKLATLCTNTQLPSEIETQLKKRLKEIYTLSQKEEEEVLRKYRIALQDSYSDTQFILAHQLLFKVLWNKEYKEKSEVSTYNDLLDILVHKNIMDNTIPH